jgi:predicted helicase
VSNAGWLDGNGLDGFRKSLQSEFSSVWVFNLRGNCRTSGELRRREGDNVFGLGSRTPISITILVKNPGTQRKEAEIHYFAVDDYMKREEKLAQLKAFHAVDSPKITWQTITPNEHGDWISQRNDLFSTFIPLEPENKFDEKTQSVFTGNSCGIATSKDSLLYNFSHQCLSRNIKQMVAFYNEQRIRFHKVGTSIQEHASDFVEYDPSKITWTDLFLRDLENNTVYKYNESKLCSSMYRPFTQQQFCYEKQLLQRTYQQTRLFPETDSSNLLICLSCRGTLKGLTVLITDKLPDYHFCGDTQCFPLYWYDEQNPDQKILFDGKAAYTKRDGVSDFILRRCREQYHAKNIGKEDVFYYVYGFLHSPGYRATFAADLKKTLPRLPLVEDVRDFWAFSKAGRELADLHLRYENQTPPPSVKVTMPTDTADKQALFRVEKMTFAKLPKKAGEKAAPDKTKIIYNSQITIEGIPLEAYDYIVNGKSAIEWLIERYAVTTDRKSGITNDPNDWGAEHGNPRYILDLVLSVITVSVKTVEIVKGLPKVEF